MTWYAVAWIIPGRYDGDDDENIWTLSQDPDMPGWETDSGHPGYGLPKHVAEWLAQAANEKEARDGHSPQHQWPTR